MVDSIPTISDEHPFILSNIQDIQDTLTVVAHNTTPHIVMSIDITWVDLTIALLACLASLLAAYFSFKGWRSQKLTQEGVREQNKRFVDFASQTKHMYRTLVYALAIDVRHHQTLQEKEHYFPQEVYLEKTKPFRELIPIQPFVNNKGAIEALGDLLNQMNLVNIEHDDAVRLINDLKNGSITYSQYVDSYELMFSNISFKPFHIIHEMLVASKKLQQSGVNCNFDEKILAQCILEKHQAYVTRFSDDIEDLKRSDLAATKFNFEHVMRSTNEFKSEDRAYLVQLGQLTQYATHKELFEHLRDVLNDKSYSEFISGEAVSIWDLLPSFYRVEVACELDRMRFHVKSGE